MNFSAVSLLALLAVPLLLLVSALVFRREPVARAKMPLWSGLAHTLLVIAVIGLAATSFVPIWRGQAMHGWLLFLHAVVAAPLLLIGLPLVIAWGGRAFAASAPPPTASILSRTVFGVFGAFGLVTTGTMLAAMLPVLGYDDLVRVIDLHRWAGLGLVVFTMVYLYAIWSRR